MSKNRVLQKLVCKVLLFNVVFNSALQLRAGWDTFNDLSKYAKGGIIALGGWAAWQQRDSVLRLAQRMRGMPHIQDNALYQALSQEKDNVALCEKENGVRLLFYSTKQPQNSSILTREFGKLENLSLDIQDLIVIPKSNQSLNTYTIIFSGPSGTGKTTMARMIAEELRVNILMVSCAELNTDSFIGTTSSKINEIFDYAKENGPIILFFDELDAIGSKRTNPKGSGEKEFNSIATAFWSLVDKHASSSCWVIAATNCNDHLDSAIHSRAKIIEFKLPNRDERVHILRLHSRHLNTNVTARFYGVLAQQTEGFSGRNIKKLIDRAGEYAKGEKCRKNLDQELVTKDHFEAALKRELESIADSIESKEKDNNSSMSTYVYIGLSVITILLTAYGLYQGRISHKEGLALQEKHHEANLAAQYAAQAKNDDWQQKSLAIQKDNAWYTEWTFKSTVGGVAVTVGYGAWKAIKILWALYGPK